jgi:hypothetical protein
MFSSTQGNRLLEGAEPTEFIGEVLDGRPGAKLKRELTLGELQSARLGSTRSELSKDLTPVLPH